MAEDMITRRFKMCVSEREAQHVLAGAFGHMHPMHWPFPGIDQPKRGRLMPSEGERMEKQINAALAIIGAPAIDQAFRDTYWREAREGQFVEEDAGGFIWRSWAAALGFRVMDGTTYPQAIAALKSHAQGQGHE